MIHVFCAGPEFPACPFVVRVNGTPLTVTVVVAFTTVTPAWDEVSVTVQEPVPPDVVHGFAVVNEPGPDAIVSVISVPSGALVNGCPVFVCTSTCAVSTWLVFTGFVAVAGEIEIRAPGTGTGGAGGGGHVTVSDAEAVSEPSLVAERLAVLL